MVVLQNWAPRSSESVALASDRLSLYRLACRKSTPRRLVLIRSASLKFDALRIKFCNLPLLRLDPLRFASLRLELLRSASGLGVVKRTYLLFQHIN